MESSVEVQISKNRWKLYNVLMLGLAFMFVFTAFQTSSMIEVRRVVVSPIFSGNNENGFAMHNNEA